MPSAHLLSRAVGAAAVAGATTLAYGALVERNWFRLREVDVPTPGRAGAAPLRVLHLTDLHLTPGQRRKAAWVRGLERLEPDLVALTGDSLAHPGAVAPLLDALGPLLDRPGVFVLGNNDYFGPVPKNPLRYFDTDHVRRFGEPLPWEALAHGLADRGWLDLDNSVGTLQVGGHRLALGGLDDPQLRRDRPEVLLGSGDPAADLRLGLVHAPEPWLLDAFAAEGYDLVLCGHTHGGQVCVPFVGALVTNCGIDRARVSGLFPWSPPGTTRRSEAWVHVCAGLGTSPYAPIRLACRPEATLLRVTPPGPVERVH